MDFQPSKRGVNSTIATNGHRGHIPCDVTGAIRAFNDTVGIYIAHLHVLLTADSDIFRLIKCLFLGTQNKQTNNNVTEFNYKLNILHKNCMPVSEEKALNSIQTD